VSVPFGCGEAQIENAIFKFITDLVQPKQMHQVKKLFFVPVGLPGMGKSTLAKHIKLAAAKHSKSGAPQSFMPSEMSAFSLSEQ